MSYTDGFVAAVPTNKKSEYIAFAKKAADIFKEYGALSVVENWSDDVPEGKVTDFARAVKLEEGEAVVFSWVTWPDKATRVTAWEKVMQDPRMQDDEMPFDGKRLIYGGFENVLDV
uniref:DUF1428 domain-containing protein n=1 Tax=Ningiella ruwaisensis TaxID=2364274 RepID=UPI00109F3647|nr:DUF1428 domain-containing protein [Ningiella ruwaisensis]